MWTQAIDLAWAFTCVGAGFAGCVAAHVLDDL
jgi:hypothetical protein